MDRLRKLRPKWTFGGTLVTNGVVACIPFERTLAKIDTVKKRKKRKRKLKGTDEPNAKRRRTKSAQKESKEEKPPKARKSQNESKQVQTETQPSKRRKEAQSTTRESKRHKTQHKPSLDQLRVGFHSQASILETYEGWSSRLQFVSVDPGVHNIMQTWAVGANHSPFELKMTKLVHDTGRLQPTMMKRYHERMVDVLLRQNEVPFRKWVHLEQMNLYFTMLGQIWDDAWSYECVKKIRRLKFRQWMKSQSVLDSFVASVKEQCDPDNTVFLFGNGGGNGGFMRLRNGCMKPPLMRIKRLLARNYPMICVDEYCTSKLCLECGQPLSHPRKGKMHATSYCAETSHRRLLNRDVDAARKIGYRFLCQLKGDDLGTLETWF